jgi:hypothetical protein
MGGGGLGMNDLGAVGINAPPENEQEPDMEDVPEAGGEEAPAPEGK